ncbi:MAG: 16S rRNA (cytosine(967)-C(5))-methyltransferase RsmB, partial [Ileibacterium sp.]|nr:16S rRNA (cytosine(967)-C(5))-methyltransferase RsmB [Ileibacterium sp.]
NDMDSLIPLQKEILENASRGVKKDGRLVYSTCTINKKENEKQVDAFLKDHPDFELEKMQTLFPDERQDGFFMACLKRKEQ